MALREFKEQAKHAFSNYGMITGSRLTTAKIVERVSARLGSRINYGFRPLEYDWDVMIILDACRADLFEEFAPQHPVFERFESVSAKYSCASTSREWFEKGFGSATSSEVADVHYVSENPYLSRLDLERFHDVDRLWELRANTDSGTLDPSVVTAQALRSYNKTGADRFVVHYIPPHAPFLHCSEKYTLQDKSWGGETHDVWFGLQVGEFDYEEVWKDYGKNLLRVLDEVERLVKHVSGSVVITADHANAIGEFGQYGHPGYVPVPALKRVPWVRLTGEGIPYDPDESSTEELEMGDSDEMVKDRLESLGYL